MKKTTILSALLLILISVYFIWYKNDPKIENVNSIKIGAILSLTGDSSAVEWGESARNGALLAIEEINNRGGVDGNKVNIVIEDMQSSSKGSISAANKLIDVHKVQGMIVSWLDVYQGVAPYAQKFNIPIISPDGGIEAINSETIYSNVFSTWYRTDVKAEKIVKYMKSIGVARLATVFQNDSYYTDFANRVVKYAHTYGIEVVASEYINSGTSDINTQILKVRESKPDAVMVALYDKKNMNSFLTISRQIQLNSRLFGDELLLDYTKDKELVGMLDGTVYFHASSPDNKFVDNYKKKYDQDPKYGASTAYDAVMILARAISQKEPRESFDEYMRRNTFDSVSYGQLKFDNLGGVDTQNSQFDLFRFEKGESYKITQ